MISQVQTPDSISPTPPPSTDNTAAGRPTITAPDLRRLGADSYDLCLPETHYLPHLLIPDEVVEGVIYGRYRHEGNTAKGRGMLVATNRRILLIDRKPLFIKASEVAYEVVSGIAQMSSGLGCTVTLSTRMGNFSVRTFNIHCAGRLVQAVESHIFRQPADFRPINPS